ncbi:MAG: succinylglutamate desuccinylase/aspartoacylase family protein [Bacteriovorax sp.]|nr:succinylglutamate desuccinylase/aspartoacylase family protein [Bacteriovorax sp.]
MRFNTGLIVLFFSTSSLATNIATKHTIDESYWIKENKSEIFELLKSRPELTIDHVSTSGFELYGPKGLEGFLQQNLIEYRPLENANQNLRSEYPTPEAVEKDLKIIAKKYPGITKLYSIGKSVKNRDLWVMKLSRNANLDDDRPEFKYIANMHGDEIVGREVMLRFIKECVENYGKDPRLTTLLDKFQIHILVSMNPDGAAAGTRANSNHSDLNRDFPDFSTSDNQDTTDKREPETQAVMKWQGEHNFRLSANFHGGSEVVNYPWDTIPDRFPEEDLVKDLSHEYAQNAPYIAASTTFSNGITNGFAWYEVNGGMQDWSIYWRKDLQITIELSNSKWPDYSSIDYYYQQNRPALIKFIERIELIVKR